MTYVHWLVSTGRLRGWLTRASRSWAAASVVSPPRCRCSLRRRNQARPTPRPRGLRRLGADRAWRERRLVDVHHHCPVCDRRNRRQAICRRLASGVLVATRSTFAVGDEIEVDGVMGQVERIANRSTVLRNRDGLRVHIPNSELVDKTVTIYTAYDERRAAIELTVALHTDLEPRRGSSETLWAGLSRSASNRQRVIQGGPKVWCSPGLRAMNSIRPHRPYVDRARGMIA